MKYPIIVAYSYAAIVAVGGVIGFAAVGSIASLIAGVAFALLLALFAALMQRQNAIGMGGTLATTSVLVLFFIYRFVLTQKMMPAGMMALVSIAVLFILFNSMQRQKA